MKPEDTIQFMLDFYYDMYYSRDSVLSHMFCTCGSGFVWENGELVLCDSDIERMNRYQLKEPVIRAEPSGLNVLLHDVHVERSALRNKRIQERRVSKGLPLKTEDVEQLWSKPTSLFHELPDDITPEWKTIVDEVREKLISAGVDITYKENFRNYIMPHKGD